MNFHQRIHQVSAQDGVEAVLALRPDEGPLYVGEGLHRGLAESAARIQNAAPTTMIRVNAGTHAIFASAEDGTTVVLIFKKAHPVVKSVKRTMRQLLRKASRERARERRISLRPPLPSQPPASRPPSMRMAGF